MRLICGSLLVVSLSALAPVTMCAQAQSESSRAVNGGGVSVRGWTGKIDANEEKNGAKLDNAKLAQEGGALQQAQSMVIKFVQWPGCMKKLGGEALYLASMRPVFDQ